MPCVKAAADQSFPLDSFSEVLYLDSDNIPLTDPSYLFDHEVYKRHGAVFWPDFPVDVSHAISRIWIKVPVASPRLTLLSIGLYRGGMRP